MKKILIATISEATNTALSMALSLYETHICSTGTTALELLETLRPDVLILDLMLPYMDGFAILRKSSFKPRIILARTNFVSATVLQTATSLGVQDIILIPCTIQYIISRLEYLTENVPSPES